MSSRNAVLSGRQTPRVSLVPKSVRNDSEDAVFLASGYGLTPDEWQCTVLAHWLGRLPTGKWSAGRCGLAVPRQNGKNGVIEVRELFGMVELGERFLHTAHEVKTARKAFKRLQFFFGESAGDPGAKFPELNALVREVRSANGQEAITLHNGGSVEFVARSRGSGRGFTVDVLVIDEAQELTDEHLEALLPTISSAPLGNPQTIMTGTPPSAIGQGEVFTRTRNAGVEGKATRLAWDEWSISGSADIYDRKNWFDTNPALGDRLQITVIEDELPPGMSPEGFARERLGRWSAPGEGSGPFPDGMWEAGIDVDSQIPANGLVVYCLDVSNDRGTAYVGVAGRRLDDKVHVEIVATRAGTDWVAGWFADRTPNGAMSVVVQGKGAPASSLIPDLQAVDGLTVIEWGGSELGNATGQLFDLVKTNRLAHTPQPVLDMAAATAQPKILSDGGMAWDRRRSATDIAPLVVVTGAAWGLTQYKPPFRSRYEDPTATLLVL